MYQAQQANADAPHPGVSFREFVAIMAAMMATNALAVDSMLPALPDIGAALGVSGDNRHQTVITAYLLGFGIAQLFYGPLSDLFGRKPVVIAGLLLYAVSGGIAVIATSFDQMLIARALQGVGAAATRVIAVSIIRDCYGGRRMASVMSLIMMVFIVVPVIAPTVGQIIMTFGPWRAIFGVLTTFGAAVAVWTAVRLPETLPPYRRTPVAIGAVLRAYATALSNRTAMGYTVASGLVMGGLFGFINSAQQIFVGIFDLGAGFPIAFAFIALFMALSSFVNSRIVERLGMRRVSHTAIIGFTLISLAHTAAAWAGVENVWSFIAFQATTMFMFGMVMSNFNAMAMEPLGRIAGTASSTLGFITTVGGAILGYLIGQAFDGTTVPLAAGFGVLGTLAVLVVLLTEKGRLFHPHQQAGH